MDVNWLWISLYRESTDWRPGSGLHHENKEMAFDSKHIENVSLYRKTYKKIGPFRRTHQLKPLQYFKLTSWILFCQPNCITHGHAEKCFQQGQLSFNALCTPQTPTPRDFSPDVSPDVTDCHFLFFSLFFLATITYFSQIFSAFMNYCKGQHRPNTHWHLLKTLWLPKNCGNTAIPYQSLVSICLASKTSANPSVPNYGHSWN